MWYKWLFNYNNRIKLKITGSNIKLFIRELNTNHIDLLRIEYPLPKTIYITIRDTDYEKILLLNTVYELEIIEIYGGIKLKKVLKNNRYIFITLLIGIYILLLLSNVIFGVQVMHSNSKIRALLIDELANRGIKRLAFKKSFDEIQKIEADILNKNKSKIEWLEIKAEGTKYIVRVEERKIEAKKENIKYQHIVARRNGIIKIIDASNGDIVRIVNEYVKKGDILISGAIIRNEKIIKNVKADGKVYAEVWYTTRVEYPLSYREEIKTGKTKQTYAITFLDHRWPLFDFNPFKDKKIKAINLVTLPLVPFKIVREQQEELKIINEKCTKEEALIRANRVARQKMEERLKENEKIISQQNLDVKIQNNKVIANIFFSIYENIGVGRPFVPEQKVKK